jgi:hypothetical protein
MLLEMERMFREALTRFPHTARAGRSTSSSPTSTGSARSGEFWVEPMTRVFAEFRIDPREGQRGEGGRRRDAAGEEAAGG